MQTIITTAAIIWIISLSTAYCQQMPGKPVADKYPDTTSIWKMLNSPPHLALVDNDSLINEYEAAYRSSVKLDYQFGKFMSSYNLGYVYGLKFYEVLSMQCWKRTIDIASQDKNYQKWLGDIYLTIAGQYAMSDPGGKCLHWLHISKNYLLKHADSYSDPQLYNVHLWDLNTRLANAYFKSKKPQEGQQCLDYLLKHVTSRDTIRNLDVDVVRYNKAISDGKYEECLRISQKIISRVIMMDGNARRKSGFYLFYPRVYNGLNQYETALAYIDSARMDRRYKTQVAIRIFVDRQEIDILTKMGDFKKATLQMARLENYKDSLNNKNEMVIASHQRSELELDNYIRELAMEEIESNNKTIINFLLAIVSLLIVFILVTRYQRFTKSLKRSHSVEKIEVGNDIHDVVNPALTYVRMTIANMCSNNVFPPQQLQQLIPILDSSILNVRQLSAWVRSSAEMESFTDIVDQMIERSSNAYNLKITKSISLPEQLLTSSIKSTLYFIIEELLLNTWKHAQGDSCFLSLTSEPGHIELVYGDNGKGFSPGKILKGVGLSSIQNRIDKLRGSFKYIDLKNGEKYTYQIVIQIHFNNHK